MKLVEPKVEVLFAPKYAEAMNLLEVAIRNCYDSLGSICHGSAEKIISHVIKNGHCYDGDTEILTDEGYIKFSEYNGQRVAVVNKDGTFKGFEYPNMTIRKSYTGRMYDFGSTLGFSVTDKHNMFGVVYSTSASAHSNKYRLFSVGDVDYKSQTWRTKTNGERKFWSPASCRFDGQLNPYYQLVGFWIGDGHKDCSKNILMFHLKKRRKIDYLKSLCEKLGYEFKTMKNDMYYVCYNNIGNTFKSTYLCGSVKYIPMDIVEPVYIASIIDGLYNSDGNTTNYHTEIATTSKYVLNWLCERGVLAGKCFYKSYTNKNGCHAASLFSFDRYLVNDSRKPDSYAKLIDVVDFPVYCVSTSTGIIVVRGKTNKPVLCGNCSMLEFLNVTVRITTSRNVLAQLSRHRHITMAVNSQRYINYTSKKYNRELSFIVPEDLDDVQYLTWRAACQQAEDSYIELIEKYHKSTDTARSVLPNCTATTIVMTANIREWRHILELRCDKHASPDMQKIAKMLLKELYLQYPILFKDLMTKFK